MPSPGDYGCAPNIAVGDAGLMLRRTDAGFERVDVGVTVDFVDMSQYEGRFTVSSGSGMVRANIA